MVSGFVKALRLVVIGVGHMGRFHAEKIRALGAERFDVELVAVFDRNAERCAQAASHFGARALGGLDEAPACADAAVVAVPTIAHAEVARPLLESGLDVLVEKPIAASLEQAERLLALARDQGRVLQVGHLEWFNAAMQTARAHLRQPRFIEAHRLGPFPARATDVDVVRDLMIHDIDIAQRLLGAEPERIDAIGVPVVTSFVDIANARLVFPGGSVANLTASRVSPATLRRIRFFQPDAYLSVDLLEQTVWSAERNAARNAVAAQQPIALQRLEVERGDALQSQLRSFVTAVRTREVETGAGGQGLAALRTALRVIAAMSSPGDAGR